MMRLVAAACAVGLFLVPLTVIPIALVAVPGAVGLGLAAVGVATLWRWAFTAAACVFVADYAGALWIAMPPVRVVTATGFGLAILLLLHAGEVARCGRYAAMDASFLRSQVLGWIGYGVATIGAALLITGVARGVAHAVPLAAAPLIAGAGALGCLLALVLALTRAARR
jgi:hypothetical protein